MKLAASKVDFRIGCIVGVKVVLAVPDVVAVVEVVVVEGRVVVLAGMQMKCIKNLNFSII